MLQTQNAEASIMGASMSIRLCLDCGEPIPAKRLAAKPHAKRCVPCQSKQDVVLTEMPVNLGRLGFIADVRGDDDAPERGFHIGTVPLVDLMGVAEHEPGQAKNTGHRVISTHGRVKMSEMSHARKN